MSQGIIRMMENQIQEARAQLAAMTQERDLAAEVSKAWIQKCIDYEHELVSDHGGHVGLRDQLAAMTQELDECEKRCNAICTPDLINHLRQQLAARDARIQAFESDGHVSRAENQRLRTKALEAEAAYDERSKQLALARTALEAIINDTYWHDDACKVAQQALSEMGAV